MIVRPSREAHANRYQPNQLWRLIKKIYEQSVPREPLPRWHRRLLETSYILDRTPMDDTDVSDSFDDIPLVFRKKGIGWAEAELLRFILLGKYDRVLNVIGPRGSGKTSLVHYVEALLFNSPYKTKRAVAIVSGLSIFPLIQAHQDVKEKHIIDLISQEFSELSVKYSATPWQSAFAEGASLLANASNEIEFASAMNQVCQYLPKQDPRCLTFMVDNLDPLPSRVIDMAFSMFRVLYEKTHIGSAFFLRKGNLFSDTNIDGSQSLFRPRLRLGTPSSSKWLSDLPHRMAITAKELWQNKPLVCTWGVLDDRHLEIAMKNLIGIIESRKRAAENVLPYLQFMAGEDMRSLRDLFPRILKNRNLPLKEIFSENQSAEVTADDFHPLRAMMEGGHILYTDCPEIRNLLHFKSRKVPGWGSYLLYHRILALLSGHDSVPTDRFLVRMQCLGYQGTVLREALNRLWESHLVRWSCHDDRLKAGNIPLRLWASAAGEFFLQKLLRSINYLRNAVLDTPLEHRSLLRCYRAQDYGPNFLTIIDDLYDLYDLVFEEETREIIAFMQKKRTEETKTVLDALLERGLLCECILEGIHAGIFSGYESKSPEVKKWANDLNTKNRLDLCYGQLAALKERMERVRESIGSLLVSDQSFQYVSKSLSITLSIEESGKDLGIVIRTHGRDSQDIAFVSISGVDAGLEAGAAAAIRQSADPELLEPIGPFDCLLTPNRKVKGKDDFNIQAIIDKSPRKRVGCLSAQPIEGGVRLVIQLYQGSVKYPGCRQELTKISSNDLDDLKDYLDEAIPNLQRMSEMDQRKKFLSVQEEVRERFLGQDKEGHMTTIKKTLVRADRMLVHVHAQHQHLPWEWLLVNPYPQNKIIDLVRWPVDTMNERIQWVLSAEQEDERPLGSLTTAGSQEAFPSGYTTVMDRIEAAHFLHIIGESDCDKIKVLYSSAELELADIKTNVPKNATCAVLSACKVASLPPAVNFAVLIADRWRCPCWAPLFALTEDQAFQLDAELRSISAGGCARDVTRLMFSSQRRFPFLNLFVRYGLARAW